jgi:hypothetical protein
MAVTKIKPIKSTLSKALDYIQNPDKTDGKMLVSSFGCSYETADIEFGFTLAQAIEKGNNLAHHLIQSFEPGEVDYEKAHAIGKQLADAVTKGQHEYVLTTHIDKGHIHNHIIFCAVNFVDYHKYNSNKRSYYGIRNMSDKLCRENGLSVVVPGKGSKGKSYAEYQAEKVGTSWKGKLKIAVDTLIPQVASFEELLQRLQAAGYEIKPGKYISCRAPGQERFTRLKTLGADYTEEAIKERIEGKRTKAAKAPKEQRGEKERDRCAEIITPTPPWTMERTLWRRWPPPPGRRGDGPATKNTSCRIRSPVAGCRRIPRRPRRANGVGGCASPLPLP